MPSETGSLLPAESQEVSLPGEAFTTVATPRRLLTDSTFVLATQVLSLVCAFGTNALIAWLVGPEGRGLIYMMQVISGIGLTLLNFGLGTAAIYYLRKGDSLADVKSGLFWSSVIIGVLPVIALLAAWPLVGRFLTGIPPRYFWLALSVVPAMALAFNEGLLMLGQGRVAVYNALRIAPSVVLLFGMVGLAISRHEAVSQVAEAWAASFFLTLVYGAILIRPFHDLRWTAAAWRFVRKGFRLAWRSHLGAVTQYLQHRVDVLLVSGFLGIRALGIYAFAVSLAELLWYVPQAVGTILLPHIAECSEDEASRITPIICGIALAITTFLSFGLAIVASWAVPRFLPDFRVSVEVLWLLLPGIVAASVFKVLASDFNGRGEPLKTFYPPLIALVFVVAGGVLAIPRWHLHGAAVVTSLGYILNSLIYVRLYSRTAGVRSGDLWLRMRDVQRLVAARLPRLSV